MAYYNTFLLCTTEWCTSTRKTPQQTRECWCVMPGLSLRDTIYEIMRYGVLVKFHRDTVEVNGSVISVGIKARPEKGRANKELVGKIAEHFNVPRSRVRIVSGRASRRKVVEVAD